jgi:hypothetical protein
MVMRASVFQPVKGRDEYVAIDFNSVWEGGTLVERVNPFLSHEIGG